MQYFEVMKYLLSIDAFRGLEAGRCCLQNRQGNTRNMTEFEDLLSESYSPEAASAGWPGGNPRRQPEYFASESTNLCRIWTPCSFMFFHNIVEKIRLPVRPNQDYWVRAARFSKTSCKESCMVLRALIPFLFTTRLRKWKLKKQRNTAAADMT